MTDYPGAIDSFANPSATDTTAGVSHAAQHGNANDAIEAVETKLGTGSSTPSANTFLRGSGVGQSTWGQITSAQLAATLTDETGTGSSVFANTPTLVTPKVDTINEATAANGVNIDGVLLKDSKMNGSYITDSSLTTAQLGTGMVVQVVGTNFSAGATGTTTTPHDDTIPQITEGTEFMTQVITPKSATNRLSIEVTVYISHSVAAYMIGTLFQDTTANALAAAEEYIDAATGSVMLKMTHDMAAASVASTTFRVRCGASNAGTTTFNGTGGVRVFGAITKSSIKITEYKA